MDLIIEDMMAKLQKSETFGGRLTEAREEVERWDGAGIGYNQGELADLLAERFEVTIGRSYISELERSWQKNKMPSMEVGRALAQALKVNPGGSIGTNRIMEALAIAMHDLAGQDLSAVPDDDTDQAAQLVSQLVAHDAAIAKHQRGLRLADDAFVAGVMDLDRYKTQVDRLRGLIEAEESAKTQLQAAADAVAQRGSRADMLRDVAAGGPAMLTTEDTAAANAWLRRRVRVFVRDNQVSEVRFAFW